MSWRCQRGLHSWAFESMDDVREVTVPPHSTWVCTLVQRCRRCKLRWTRYSADLPKRVAT